MLEILLWALNADAAPQRAQRSAPPLERVAERGPITVRNAPALTLAMKAAGPGATVVLAPGDYAQVALSDLRFDTPVTLIARDVQATGFVLTNVAGLRIVGLTMALLAHVPFVGLLVPALAALSFVHFGLEALRRSRGGAIVTIAGERA